MQHVSQCNVPSQYRKFRGERIVWDEKTSDSLLQLDHKSKIKNTAFFRNSYLWAWQGCWSLSQLLLVEGKVYQAEQVIHRVNTQRMHTHRQPATLSQYRQSTASYQASCAPLCCSATSQCFWPVAAADVVFVNVKEELKPVCLFPAPSLATLSSSIPKFGHQMRCPPPTLHPS